MKVIIGYIDEFKRRAKILRKKYSSFESDYKVFINELKNNPYGGEPLGHHTYKHRMAIFSKGKGNSGGSRVLTYNVEHLSEDKVIVTLLTIYDKNEISNVSDSYIKSLVKEMESNL
ncbi:MAG: addiction module toxin RelE [Prevotella sp.]|nr:addiction module toxin RelE [Prevotella sp.]